MFSSMNIKNKVKVLVKQQPWLSVTDKHASAETEEISVTKIYSLETGFSECS